MDLYSTLRRPPATAHSIRTRESALRSMALNVFLRSSNVFYAMSPMRIRNNLKKKKKRKVKMFRLQHWYNDGPKAMTAATMAATAHDTFTLESDPLCCNYGFLFFYILFSCPESCLRQSRTLRTSPAHTLTHTECCDLFWIFAHAANLLLLVCVAPITLNTRVNVYSARDAVHIW